MFVSVLFLYLDGHERAEVGCMMAMGTGGISPLALPLLRPRELAVAVWIIHCFNTVNTNTIF